MISPMGRWRTRARPRLALTTVPVRSSIATGSTMASKVRSHSFLPLSRLSTRRRWGWAWVPELTRRAKGGLVGRSATCAASLAASVGFATTIASPTCASSRASGLWKKITSTPRPPRSEAQYAPSAPLPRTPTRSRWGSPSPDMRWKSSTEVRAGWDFFPYGASSTASVENLWVRSSRVAIDARATGLHTHAAGRSGSEPRRYSTATFRAFRTPAGGRGRRSIRSSCQRQKRITPSRTWRRSSRSFSRSTPASSSISDTMQHGRRALDSAMGLLLAERHAQPLIGERGAEQPARGQGAGKQDVAPLVVHLDHQLLAPGPDLDALLLREGQADVERVALAFLLHLDRPLLEEDGRRIGFSEHLAGEDLQQRQSHHLAVEEAGLEEGQRVERAPGLRQVPGLDRHPRLQVAGARLGRQHAVGHHAVDREAEEVQVGVEALRLVDHHPLGVEDDADGALPRVLQERPHAFELVVDALDGRQDLVRGKRHRRDAARHRPHRAQDGL